MNTKLALRIAIVCQWVLVAVSVPLSFALEHTLPIQVREYLEWEANRDLTTLDLVLMTTLLVLVIGYLVSSVSLFLLRKWARWMYLACVIVGYILVPLGGATVEHGLAYTLGDVSEMLSGVIIALVFFTDVLSADKQTADRVNSAGD